MLRRESWVGVNGKLWPGVVRNQNMGKTKMLELLKNNQAVSPKEHTCNHLAHIWQEKHTSMSLQKCSYSVTTVVFVVNKCKWTMSKLSFLCVCTDHHRQVGRNTWPYTTEKWGESQIIKRIPLATLQNLISIRVHSLTFKTFSRARAIQLVVLQLYLHKSTHPKSFYKPL